MAQYFEGTMATQHDMMASEEQPLKPSKLSSASTTASENISDCYECNICLDSARDPVVTLCGHLYCWPCIYKWIHFQSTSSSSDEYPQCPVCKAEVSHTTLVPLYGREDSLPQSEPGAKQSNIPNRPPAAHRLHSALTTSTTRGSGTSGQDSRGGSFQFQSNPQQQYYPEFYSNNNSTSSPLLNLGSTNIHPMVGMFGEMVYARMFGNGTEIGLFGHPNSYYLVENSSPRVRRQNMKAEKSLNRISIFLFCCVVLCLLLF